LSSLVIALVSVLVILVAMTGLVTGFTGPQAQIGETVKQAGSLSGEVSRTALGSLDVSVTSGVAGNFADWSLRNEGQTELREFDKWDVVIIYQDNPGSGLVVQRLSYSPTDPPGVGNWTVSGIYQDAGTLTDEVYDPGILNPGEEVIISAQLSPAVAETTTNRFTLAVANGVRVTTQFVN
jgi:hypothetical protein